MPIAADTYLSPGLWSPSPPHFWEWVVKARRIMHRLIHLSVETDIITTSVQGVIAIQVLREGIVPKCG